MSARVGSTSPSIQAALRSTRDTRQVALGSNLLPQIPAIFRQQFADRAPVLIADAHTMSAAGNQVLQCFDGAGFSTMPSFVFDDDVLHAEYHHVERLESALSQHDAVPVAVGAGTINDLVKLAAHRLGRPYIAVATAASMDGYSAYGASITHRGSKQTFDCPAPRAIVADFDLIRAAPPQLNAAGYADLLAKITAGADWILADALGVEPIDSTAWQTVQGGLRAALNDPAAVRRGEPYAITRLMEGLLMSGFAMQATLSSRPASGAEHQFSHLWDMQHHTHEGWPPSHGSKVGVATLAVARLYESLLHHPIERLDIDHALSQWPKWEQAQQRIEQLLAPGPLRDKAIQETRAKHSDHAALRDQLQLLRRLWPDLRQRLQAHLLPSDQMARMLEDAGAPTRPESIGISPQRLRDSFRLAYHIRRRFTVLDLAERMGLLDQL